MGGQVSEQYWASVIATALVALAFQPLRRGVQRLGDRVVYGRRAAPYEALAELCRAWPKRSPWSVLPGIAEVSGRQHRCRIRNRQTGCGRRRTTSSHTGRRSPRWSARPPASIIRSRWGRR